MSDYVSDVYDRFAEVIPVQTLDDVDAESFKKSLKISLEIIGYTPKNPENLDLKSLEIWLDEFRKSSKNPSLFEAIFKWWREDYGN